MTPKKNVTQDLTGRVFGRLTALYVDHVSPNGGQEMDVFLFLPVGEEGCKRALHSLKGEARGCGCTVREGRVTHGGACR